MSEEYKGYTIINAEHDIAKPWNGRLRIMEGEGVMAYENFSHPTLF